MADKKDTKSEMKRIFKVYDKDGDGFISRHELERILRRLSNDWTESEFDELFKAVDKNGDGKISYDEFVDWVTGADSSGGEVVEMTKTVFNLDSNGLQCREGHILTHFSPDIDGWCCEECSSDLPEGAAALQCEICGDLTWCPSCAIQISSTCPSHVADNGQTTLLRLIGRGRDYFLVTLMEVEDMVRDGASQEQLDERFLSIQTLVGVILDLVERLQGCTSWSDDARVLFKQIQELINPEQFNEAIKAPEKKKEKEASLSSIAEKRNVIGHSSVWKQLRNIFALEHFKAALLQCVARIKLLAKLPTTSIQMTVPLDSASKHDSINFKKIQNVVGLTLQDFGVDGVKATCKTSGRILQCSIKFYGNWSAQAVAGCLKEQLQDKTDSRGLQAMLKEAGAKVADAQVEPEWPFERIQAAIKLEYGYTLTLEELGKLVPAIAKSCEMYGNAWEQAKDPDCKDYLEDLLQRESLSLFADPSSTSRFKDVLLSSTIGNRRGLSPVWVIQDATGLKQVMSDAADAQLHLKGHLVPSAEWGHAVLNDVDEVPQGHAKRTHITGSSDPVSNGACYDPGIKGRSRVEEKARSRMREFDTEPPVGSLVDISRLGIVFEQIEHLQSTLEWILEHSDVAWMDNKFRNPSCLGYRDVNIGIRQLVTPSGGPDKERVHVTELQLLLKGLYDLKQSDGHKFYEVIRSIFASCQVKYKDVDNIQRLIVRMLDCTAHQEISETALELRRVELKAEELGCPETAKELITELNAARLLAKRAVFLSDPDGVDDEVNDFITSGQVEWPMIGEWGYGHPRFPCAGTGPAGTMTFQEAMSHLKVDIPPIPKYDIIAGKLESLTEVVQNYPADDPESIHARMWLEKLGSSLSSFLDARFTLLASWMEDAKSFLEGFDIGEIIEHSNQAYEYSIRTLLGDTEIFRTCDDDVFEAMHELSSLLVKFNLEKVSWDYNEQSLSEMKERWDKILKLSQEVREKGKILGKRGDGATGLSHIYPKMGKKSYDDDIDEDSS